MIDTSKSQPEASQPPPAPVPGTPRNVSVYLHQVRELMSEASVLRRSWIRQVGVLILDARAKPPEMVAPGAASCGSQQRELLTGIRVRLSQIPLPTGCETCQDAFVAWLEKQLLACGLLEEIGRTGDMTTLRAVQRVLADSRADTAAFTNAYTILVTGLKQQVEAKKRLKSLFGRKQR
jgi:hypothetical protein